MGSIRLDTVNDCARKGYNLRIRCLACGHVVDASAALMAMQLRRQVSLKAFEDRVTCSRCGKRNGHVVPVEAEF